MLFYLLMIDSPEDRSKFEKLYLQYRKLMYTVAFNILKNPQDAEDTVHYAFVKIAENIENIDDTIEARTKGLVVTITEHKAIDLFHHKQRHPTEDLQACHGIVFEYEGTNELAACMAKLPAKYRDILLLKHHHGYSSKEVAKILGMTESNVIKTEQRAKKMLEALCKEAEIW